MSHRLYADALLLGDPVNEGDSDGVGLAEWDLDPDGLTEGEADLLADAEELTLVLGLADAELDFEADADELTLLLGLAEAELDFEAEADELGLALLDVEGDADFEADADELGLLLLDVEGEADFEAEADELGLALTLVDGDADFEADAELLTLIDGVALPVAARVNPLTRIDTLPAPDASIDSEVFGSSTIGSSTKSKWKKPPAAPPRGPSKTLAFVPELSPQPIVTVIAAQTATCNSSTTSSYPLPGGSMIRSQPLASLLAHRRFHRVKSPV